MISPEYTQYLPSGAGGKALPFPLPLGPGGKALPFPLPSRAGGKALPLPLPSAAPRPCPLAPPLGYAAWAWM